MSIIQISALAIITTILSVILRKSAAEFSIYLSLIFGTFVFISITKYIGNISNSVYELVGKFNLNSEFFAIILKIVVVSYICEFASTICEDAGEKSNAAKVEFAGKIIIIALTIPIIISLADLILTLI
ncbi:MAG: stage III sporulation protein AD [Ruminococcaceae bacterium]|nr:stage III sporulation protein AD [Oscillospiraceae bacterium]